MTESVTTAVIEKDIYSWKRAQGKFSRVFLWALMVVKPSELETIKASGIQAIKSMVKKWKLNFDSTQLNIFKMMMD